MVKLPIVAPVGSVTLTFTEATPEFSVMSAPMVTSWGTSWGSGVAQASEIWGGVLSIVALRNTSTISGSPTGRGSGSMITVLLFSPLTVMLTAA